MAARSISETTQVRYLLGLSFPAERERIESEFFEDDDAFEEMLAAEDDLIDAYARGDLLGEEWRRFERIFASSLRGRDRVHFASAFGGIVSTTRPVETKLPYKLLSSFRTFQSSELLRIATIAAVVVFVTVLAWLVVNRTRMTKVPHERTESAELIRQTAELQRNSDTGRTRTAEITAQPTDPQAQPKPRNGERGKTAGQQRRADQANLTLDGVLVEPHSLVPSDASSSGGSTLRGTAKDQQGNIVSGASVTLTDSARNFTRTQYTNEDGAYVFNTIPKGTYSIEVKAPGFKTASVSGLSALVDTPTILDIQLEVGAVSETVIVTAAAEAVVNSTDATLGNSSEQKRIIELPLNANKVVGLLSLQPGVSRTGFVNGGRADQSNITLEGVDVAIPIASFLSWIRYQIVLDTAAIYEEFRVTIRTLDGCPVTSLDWIELFGPNQTIVDTPVMRMDALPSGDYVLELMGKEAGGSFVKVAEYSFNIIKY